jgi:uncharacterized protein DUF922
MGGRIPGVIGADPAEKLDVPRGGSFVDPGPGGMDAPTPLTDRNIADVKDDWHPPAPDTSAFVEVSGDTLEDVADALKKLDEWGQGGGALRNEPIAPGSSTNLTVTLHGNLVLRLPKWKNYNSASTAAKREWDRMLGKLKAHEQRHMDIAIEHGDALAKELAGKEIGVLAKMVTARNAQMAADQKKLDDDTDHGSKSGVQYGDVSLDASVE